MNRRMAGRWRAHWLGVALWLALSVAPAMAQSVAPGAEVLILRFPEWIEGKRVGLIANPSAVTRDGRSTIDLLHGRPECNLVSLFAPEHGLRADEPAGQWIEDERDPVTGLAVYSLYGDTRRPTPEMLESLDALIYDIQDIGVRGYTYISTMRYAMEAAFEAGKTFIVCDRPDPLGGVRVEGPILPESMISFVGAAELPWVYGMTPGEVARWMKRDLGLDGDLKVAPMAGWKRGMRFEQTGLRWVPPSPNIPRAETALHYAITGAIGELGTVSEGVGTDRPFERIGAPWLEGERLAGYLNARELPGIVLNPVRFTPNGYAFDGRLCRGAQIQIEDFDAVSPAYTMAALAEAIVRIHSSEHLFKGGNSAMFDKVLGDPRFRADIENGTPAGEIVRRWSAQCRAFASSRRQALIYAPASR